MKFTEWLEDLIVSYQWFRELGGPSATMRLNDSSPTGESPPSWLIRMIEVGVALDALMDAERDAVWDRFNALRARDAALSRVMTAHMRQLAGHRERDGHSIRHWRREERVAWNDYARQDRRRQLFERTREYWRGMDRLAKMLGGE